VIEAAYGRAFDSSRAELYVHELVGMGCLACAKEAIQDVVRTSVYVPTIADLVGRYRLNLGAIHDEHIDKPALPSQASFTEAERERSLEVMREVLPSFLSKEIPRPVTLEEPRSGRAALASDSERRGGVCAEAIGKPAKFIDGKPCCPACDAPIEEMTG